MNPTANSLHVDSLLTNMSIGYKNLSYIADEAFPIVPVMKQSDIIPQFDQSHWFRDLAVVRAPGTKSQRAGWKVTTDDTYYCKRFSFGAEIADDIRNNTDQPFNLDREAEFVSDKMALKREAAFATDFFTSSVWGTDKTGGTDFNKWSSYGDSTPLVDITGWQDDVEALIATEPKCLIIGKQVWVQLKWHPSVIDSIKYTQTGVASPGLFASLADLDKLLIGRAIKTTTNMGVAESSVSYSRIWGKSTLLLYVPPSASLMKPAAGYTFVWNVVPGALQYMKRMRDEESELDIIEGNSYFDQKSIVTAAGLYSGSTVA